MKTQDRINEYVRRLEIIKDGEQFFKLTGRIDELRQLCDEFGEVVSGILLSVQNDENEYAIGTLSKLEYHLKKCGEIIDNNLILLSKREEEKA